MEDAIPESSSVSQARLENGSHDWVLRNWSLLQKGPVFSDEFTTCGHRWKLLLHPDGAEVGAANVGYSSLYLCLRDNGNDQKPVHTLLELCLLDQSGKGNHHVTEPMKGISMKRGTMCGIGRFVGRKILESVYLKDDCLMFRCKIGVLKFQIQKLPPLKVTGSNIGADFGKLLESKESGDVVFKLGDGSSFWGHKWILFASSPVFRSLLLDCNHHQPQEIVVSEMEPTIFKAILRFLYTGTLEEDDVNFCGSSILTSFMGKVLAAADRYELKILKNVCELRISEKISVESVAYLFHLADLCHATELKASCLRFAAENQKAALESEGCEYLQQSYPSLFLELAYQNPSSSGEGEVDFFSKVLSAVRASSAYLYLDESGMKEI